MIFIFHLITSSFRKSIVWSGVLTIAMTGAMVLIGVLVGKLMEGLPIAYVLVAVFSGELRSKLVLVGYQDFKTQVVRISGSELPESSEAKRL